MSEPIRVLHLIGRLDIGGPTLHALLACAGLDPARFRATLVSDRTRDDEDDMSDVARSRGVDLQILPGLAHPRGFPAVVRLLRMFARTRPHVVHTHALRAGRAGRVAAWAWNRLRPRDAPPLRVVHGYHSHTGRHAFGALQEDQFRTAEGWLARATDRIAVPTESFARDLLARGIGRPSQFVVIPTAADVDGLLGTGVRRPGDRGALRTEFDLPGEAILIGVIGRLSPEKNHAAVIAAGSRLRRRTRRDVRYVFVGDGECRRELQEQARGFGMADRVVFTGWRKDLRAVYEDLDVVALASRHEWSPTSAVEGMAAGRAVVATAVGGAADVVDDARTGLLVPPERDDLFAIALGRLADDDELRTRLASAGRAEAAQRFTPARLIRELDALYGGLIEGGRG